MTDVESGAQSFQGMRSLAPANWVVRKHNHMMFAAPKAKDAVRWLNSHLSATEPGITMREAVSLDHGWKVTRSYWAKAYYDGFGPEFEKEADAFDTATEYLRAWIHQSWQWDIANHPGPAGRFAAQERWKDVDALLNIAALTLQPNPVFHYNLGKLSPPEGRGHRLHLMIRPLTMEELKGMVSHSV